MLNLNTKKSNGALSKLREFKNIRKRIVFCPTAKIRAHVTPLTVGDDLILKTITTSPDLYDKEITRLVYNHTEFVDMEHRPSIEEFTKNISKFDRATLIWGIYSVTYETFGKQDISCPNCSAKYQDEIKVIELVDIDFAKLWDKEESFKDYRFTVREELKEETLPFIDFVMKIPAVEDQTKVLRYVSNFKLKDNQSRFGELLSLNEELALVISSINVYSDLNNFECISELPDIFEALGALIPRNYSVDALGKYNDHFREYAPVFKKPQQCPECSHQFDYIVDIETSLFASFFRNFLRQ